MLLPFIFITFSVILIAFFKLFEELYVTKEETVRLSLQISDLKKVLLA
jgi:hypothetical protein